MEPLDERRLRKPDFRDGTGVILRDGQTWTFPKPWLRLYPVRTADGSFTVGGGLGFDADYEELAGQLAAGPSDDPVRKLEIQFRMAAGLLCRNYELTDAHLRRLLAVDLDDDSCRECWARINEVLLGRVPKPSADGSAGPCS
jgi:hypothetical protein